MCLIEWPATGIVASGTGYHGLVPPNSDSLYSSDGGDSGVRAHVCMRAYSRVCMCACGRVCVRDVFAIYDKNI